MTQSRLSNTSALNIAAWNVNCNTEIANCYLNELASTADFIALSEHGLFPCELEKLNSIIPGYTSFAKSSSQLSDNDFGYKRRIGGCAILWNERKFRYKVKPNLTLGSDRILVVELHAANQIHFIIAVYMPHQTCNISDYATELRILQDVIDECMPRGYCYIVGDLNVHFGEEYKSHHMDRAWGESNRNASKLHRFIVTNNMIAIDLCSSASGECYSFSGGHGISYLDHIIIPNDISSNVSTCQVFRDSIYNPSDHLPLFISICYCIRYDPSNETSNRRVAWSKLNQDQIRQDYTLPLEESITDMLNSHNIIIDSMHQNEFPLIDHTTLDIIFSTLGNSIKHISNKLPSNVYNKSLKPYWDKDLTALSRSKRNTRAVWINAGKPRNINSEEYVSYKQSKREFRKQQRRRVYDMQNRNMLEFSETQDLDSKYFWHIVNKQKKGTTFTPIKNDENRMLTNLTDIRNEWTRYYDKLFSETDNEQYDDKFKTRINEEVSQFDKYATCQEYLEGGTITIDEIKACISKLRNKKAPGWDFITSEHLKNAGPIFTAALSWMLNTCVVNSYIPKYLKRGLLVPIPKANKDVSIKDNNRGITLMPVFYKLFEKLMIEREHAWLQNNSVIDSIQSAGREKLSCLHTSFIVQETIAYNLNRGNAVYAAFLDVRKAFDTVWISGMLYKLMMTGINTKLWRLIKSGYTDFECAVFVGGTLGEWFYPKRGVHQGAPMSMYLYLIYVNDLIVNLRKSCHGTSLDGTIITSPAHADDITLLALFKDSLNVLLNIAYEYGNKWRYTFNTLKTEFIIWGSDIRPSLNVRFGKDILKPVQMCKHMGIKLYSDKKLVKSIFEERIGSAKRVMYAAKGLGSQSIPVPPTILSKIYWSVAIPKMLYGLEVCPLSDNSILMLEDAHRQFARSVQYLPQNTHIPANCATVGWITIQPFIAIAKIMFVLRTLCLPTTNLFRTVLVSRLINLTNNDVYLQETYEGPIKSALKYFHKYDLISILMEFIYNGSEDVLKMTKNRIKAIVFDIEIQQWKASCILYQDLSLYMKCVNTIRMNSWWVLAKKKPYLVYKISAVMAVLMGNQPKGFQCNFRNKFCSMCPNRQLDSPKHILFECDALSNLRSTKLRELIDSMPEGMKYSFDDLHTDDKIVFLLSGLHCKSFIKEWEDILIKICEFVYDIYHERKNIYDLG